MPATTHDDEERLMPQGTIKHYDAEEGTGSVLMDDRTEVVIDQSSTEGSGHIRYLRIGQRVVFDVAEEAGRLVARSLKIISFA
jgi:cold shock CspA family protein